jgi:hypothetical protein
MSSGGYRTEKTGGVATEAQVVASTLARSLRQGRWVLYILCVSREAEKYLAPASKRASEWEEKRDTHDACECNVFMAIEDASIKFNLHEKKNRCQPGALRSHKNSQQQQQLPHTNAFGYFLFFSQGRCLFEINIMRPVAGALF